jgi:hypothetical protein
MLRFVIGVCCLAVLSSCSSSERLCKANLAGLTDSGWEILSANEISTEQYSAAIDKFMNKMGSVQKNAGSQALQGPQYQGAAFMKFNLQKMNYYKKKVKLTKYCMVIGGECDCTVSEQNQSLKDLQP